MKKDNVWKTIANKGLKYFRESSPQRFLGGVFGLVAITMTPMMINASLAEYVTRKEERVVRSRQEIQQLYDRRKEIKKELNSYYLALYEPLDDKLRKIPEIRDAIEKILDKKEKLQMEFDFVGVEIMSYYREDLELMKLRNKRIKYENNEWIYGPVFPPWCLEKMLCKRHHGEREPRFGLLDEGFICVNRQLDK